MFRATLAIITVSFMEFVPELLAVSAILALAIGSHVISLIVNSHICVMAGFTYSAFIAALFLELV
jgi:hypothetical protein